MEELLHACCFAGAGGTCTGFRAAGCRTVFAVELGRHRARTLRLNHPHVAVVEKDIARVTATEVVSLLPRDGRLCRPIDILTMSPPCESFSTAGGMGKNNKDPRDQLYRHAVRIASWVGARTILIENVKGYTTKLALDGGREVPMLDLIRRDLATAGYEVLWHGDGRDILDASWYQVPQKRERTFVLASREPLSRVLPKPTTKDKPVTVREAFAGLPPLLGKWGQAARSSKYADLLRDDGFWRLETGWSATRKLVHVVWESKRPAEGQKGRP